MTNKKDNINKPNPKHYKLELRNTPVIINGEKTIIDSLQLEARHILKDVVNEAALTNEQAAWYWSVGKRYFRLCKKHNNPTTDIKKIIQESTFLLSSLLDKNITAKLIDENGNDLLNDHQEDFNLDDFNPFDKLKEMLSPQEQDLIKDKEIVMVRIGHDNIYLNKEDAQGVFELLGDAIYGED